MLLVDGHLDLAMNALHWNRDLKRSVPELRRFEAEMTEKGRAMGTVAFPEMRAGEIALCMATVIARVAHADSPAPGYACHEIAAAVALGQLAYYRLLEKQGELRMIRDATEMTAHLREWEENGPDRTPIGFILSMEGADPIVS